MAAAPHESRFFTDYYASAFLLLIAAFIGAAFFVLKPIILDIRETNAQTESQLKGVDVERSYLSSLEQSVAAAQAISPSTLEEVSRALPNEQNIPSLLVQFGTAAQKNRVRIEGISFTDTHVASGAQATTTTSIVPLDISLTVHAHNYFDVKRFLSDIEVSLRLMDVESISSSSAGGDLTYALQLRTYAFAPQKRP